MKYEIVIGLETHVELATASKIFCSCGGHSSTEGPNTCVCPACSGMPGMLPVTNRHAVELAVTAGLMLNCKINRYTTFDKKSYYYPDLPCAYQITQWFHPICVDGCVEVETSAGTRKIGIKQIHMEEDAGKLVHDEWTDTSMVDFNRTSVPLIEIVSRPDFRSKEEVIAYLEKLKETFRFAKISECEEGAMRCDVNISVRPEGSTELGVRTEIKNMSSLVAIERAIEYETARHIDAIEHNTEVLVQETRRFDDVKGRTFSMRNKETAADYRYFPDPNLMPIVIDDKWMDKIQSEMPMTIAEKQAEYITAGISEKDAKSLTEERSVCDLLDDTVGFGASAKDVAAWILTDCAGILRKKGMLLSDLQIEAKKFARIIELTADGTITRGAGKKLLTAVIEEDVDPDEYRKAHELDAQADESVIENIIKGVLANNQDTVDAYKAGKTKLFQALVGATMRELRGNGDPATVNAILKKLLSE